MRREVVDGRHHFVLMDASEIIDSARGNRKWTTFQRGIHEHLGTVDQFEHDVVLGSEDYALRSERLLSEVEDQIPMSRGWRTVDDVVGGVPNVPAFLAGHPQHMRRRERAMRDSAPVTIFMNLGSSMGIPPEQILRRGVVLLALARMLTAHRSVELWVGTMLSDGYSTGTAAWRIDTVPLDLARAAYHIADVSMSRMFGYAACEQLLDKHLGDRPNDEAGHQRLLARVAGWHDTLILPAIHLHDPMVTDPVGWLKRVMAKYLGEEQ